ncbi:MAG TPA: CapA family protein [Candidatus Paceibacterota bacterium]|nr:CapA family protein [Candidatus Paceibacterota bacterium]
MNWRQYLNPLLIAVAVAAVFVLLGAFSTGEFADFANPAPEASSTGASATSSDSVTLVFAGDIMLSRAIGSLMAENGFDFPYARLDGTIRDADIAFANLETPVSTRGANVGSIYSFRSDPASLAGLKNAGFDVVSMANNHIWDYGRDAFLDTISNLDDAGLKHAGGGATFADAHAPALVRAKGHTVALLAYTKLVPPFLSGNDSAPAVAYPDPTQIAADIAAAKKEGADIVIVSFHWGTEYSTTHDAAQEALAHAAIDAGALIVMGHHPHVAEEIERYKGGLIMYSLGNFVFDQNFSADTSHGLLMRVVADGKGIESVEPLEVKFNASYQPVIAGPWPQKANVL